MGGIIVALKLISSTPMTHCIAATFTLTPDRRDAGCWSRRPHGAHDRSHEGDCDLEQLLHCPYARAIRYEQDHVIVRVHHGVVVRHDDLVVAHDRRDGRALRPVSYTHLRAHETPEHLVCRLLLEKKKKK